jgi:chromosome segregation ATPase
MAFHFRTPSEMHMSSRRTIATLVLLLVACPAAAQARSYHRGRGSNAARQNMIRMAQANLAAATQMAAQAQLQIAEAQPKVDAATDRIRTSRSSMASAKSNERTAHQSLVAIQADLIEQAGPSSEIGRSHADMVAAQEKFCHEAKRILESDEYKAKVAEITDSGDRLKKLPEMREEMLRHDEAYQRTLSRLQLEHARFCRLRTDMVRNSPEWTSMSQEVRDALKEQNKAEIEATNGGFAHMKHWYRLHDAKLAYASAQATIAQCQGILRQLGVRPPPTPQSPASASGS